MFANINGLAAGLCDRLSEEPLPGTCQGSAWNTCFSGL